MTNDNNDWHELPGPHAHERGKVVRTPLSSGDDSTRPQLFWILTLAAAAATATGVVLALSA
jgi:hypothetical protein